MKAQKSYEELIQFLIANYSYYSVCPDDYLESNDSGNVEDGEVAA